ncbi:MAG: sporulation protein YtfJ, partial [Bacillota bacterium]
MKTAMESIKQMIDVNTVVGNAVETKTGAIIIPISQVS